jgi:hypothetical protein
MTSGINTMLKQIAVETLIRTTPVDMPATTLRKLKRESKRYNPPFYRALRRMTPQQFDNAEIRLREQELAKLNLARKTTEVERKIEDHKYGIRLIEDHIYFAAHPRKIKRRRFTPTVKVTVARPMPIPEEFKEPMPIPADLLQVGKKVEPVPVERNNFHSKFFHNADPWVSKG